MADFTLRTTARAIRIVLCVVLSVGGFGFGGIEAEAQNESSPANATSDLARQNLGLVAASAGEIKPILLKDAGLMVELERWLAKDATDHGQIISELDLTKDAVFDRLDNDVEFRAAATKLLQQYGYLVPEVNPNSEVGKERELLVQEQVKWITQEEQEARQQEHMQVEQNMQKARSCSSGVQADCIQQAQPGARTSPAVNPLPGGQVNPRLPPTGNNPNGSNPASFPSANTNSLETTQLLQNGAQPGGGFPELDLQSPSLAQQFEARQSEDGDSSQVGGNASLQNAMLGLSANGQPRNDLSMNGLGIGVGLVGATNDINPYEMNRPNGSEFVRQYPSAPFSQSSQNEMIQPVEMVRRAGPYQDIPSLYDMYMQAVPRPSAPRRFGIDVFENAAQDPQLIPMDLPAGPDYVVGPGDGLAIDLWGGVSQKIYRTVDREGRISLPEVGPLLVSGKSLAEVQQNLQQSLRGQFRDESADVSLARLRTIRVYEVGDVTNPGAYDISSLSTALNALFVAGGPTPNGSLRIVKHFRGGQLVETVDLYDLLLHGVKTGIERLENGDSILVPPIGPQITVEGMVRRPAIYELKDETNLSSALELAGGLLPTAALRHIEVQRLVAHEKQTMLSLDIPDGDDSAEVTKKLDAFQIQDGDRIRIFPIPSGNEDAVYLEGYVISPGRYSYHKDMRVTDVLGSYKDLLPEPATRYAEIIHLNPPDFHPSVESFNLADAFADPSQSPILHPMDTVQVFSRFDFENPPVVSVLGDVRAPGTYRTSGQIRLADAIHLAGGLDPDAQTSDAQVFRYLPDGKFKIFNVHLGEALDGNPTENIVLEARDRLLIHRNPDAVAPMTAYIEGDVAKPGRYPLSTNMTVADLIRLGGGLKPSADTHTGDLTHFQLSDQGPPTGQHEAIAVSAALAGDPNSNVPVHNGDVVTIRQIPGWDDLGASITLKGEVKHPGTYGIRPGERLSSILERAGGFEPDAYPYGAVLERVQVRELQSNAQDQLILRVKEAQSNLELTPGATPQQQQAREMTLQQYQTTLTELTSNPPPGRVTIRISSNIGRWKSSLSDVEVRAGDTLVVPKKPSYVMVTGQVFNPTAVSYRPGRSAKWYLSQSGGPTQLANKKAIFVIRADGSVVSGSTGMTGLLSGDPLDTALLPGDTVVVPEKAIGGGVQWTNLFTAAQIASSVVSTLFIALHY